MRRMVGMFLLAVALLAWVVPSAQALGGMSLTERVKRAAATPTPTPTPISSTYPWPTPSPTPITGTAAKDVLTILRAEAAQCNENGWLSWSGTDIDWSVLPPSEYYTPFLWVKNDTKAEIVLNLEIQIDDQTFTYEETRIKTGEDHWFNVYQSSCEEMLTAGTHTVNWYVNGRFLDAMKLTVRNGRSAATPTPNPVRVGDIVTFGRYEQDGNTGNGQEPIEWQVLDVETGKALLLSRYGLDAQPYNKTNTDVTWERCTLRTWLNKDFWSTAFNAAEQGAILTTAVDNSRREGFDFNAVTFFSEKTNGGNNTQDKVFLLSCADATRYFGVTWGSGKNTKPRISPTAYAARAGAYKSDTSKTIDGESAGWWWLRSPGTHQDSTAVVNAGGALNDCSVGSGIGCVRPALWVNLESVIF